MPLTEMSDLMNFDEEFLTVFLQTSVMMRSTVVSSCSVVCSKTIFFSMLLYCHDVKQH